MLKKKTTIQFSSVHQLRAFAEAIKVSALEVIAAKAILICDCSELEIAQLPAFGGKIIEKDSLPNPPLLHSNSIQHHNGTNE